MVCISVHLLTLLYFVINAVISLGISIGLLLLVLLLVLFVNKEPAVKVRGRPPSTVSTSSSEISIADDVSRDLLHDVQTKVSQTCCWLKYWVCGL